MSDVIIVKLEDIFDVTNEADSGFKPSSIAMLKMLLSRFSHKDTLVVLVHDRCSAEAIDDHLDNMKKFKDLYPNPERFLLINIIVRLSQLIGRVVIPVNDQLEKVLKHGFYVYGRDLGLKAYESYLQYYEMAEFERCFPGVRLSCASMNRGFQFRKLLGAKYEDVQLPYTAKFIKRVLNALEHADKSYLNLELYQEFSSYMQQLVANNVPPEEYDNKLELLQSYNFSVFSNGTDRPIRITLKELRNFIAIDHEKEAATPRISPVKQAAKPVKHAKKEWQKEMVVAKEGYSVELSDELLPEKDKDQVRLNVDDLYPYTRTGCLAKAILDYLHQEYPCTIKVVRSANVYWLAPSQSISLYDTHPTKNIVKSELDQENGRASQSETRVGYAHAIVFDPSNIVDSLDKVSRELSKQYAFAFFRFLLTHNSKELSIVAYTMCIILVLATAAMGTYTGITGNQTHNVEPAISSVVPLAAGVFFNWRHRKKVRQKDLLMPDATLVLPAGVRALRDQIPILSASSSVTNSSESSIDLDEAEVTVDDVMVNRM